MCESIKAQVAEILKTTVDNVSNRVIKMGLGDGCDRCGGTGEYSFNMMCGTRCFKCGGNRCVISNSAAGWKRILKRAQALQPNAIDEYIEKCKRENMAKKALDILMAEWHEADKTIKYSEMLTLRNRGGQVEDWQERYNSNHAIYDAYEALSKESFKQNKDIDKIVELLVSGQAVIREELTKWK